MSSFGGKEEKTKKVFSPKTDELYSKLANLM
jgi:hypothetical protein